MNTCSNTESKQCLVCTFAYYQVDLVSPVKWEGKHGWNVFTASRQTVDLSPLHQVHDGQMQTFEYLNLIFQDAPVGVFWKDTDLICQGINQFGLNFFGCSTQEEIVGRSYFDWYKGNSDAEVFEEEDREIIKNGQPKFNDIKIQYDAEDKSRTFSFTRLPIYDTFQNVTGVVGLAIPIVGVANAMSTYLSDVSRLFRKGEHYYIVVNERAVRLTARQAACLTYLATGKTMKQIANTFECCPKTVEYHADVLKQKLNAYAMADLVNCFWCNPIKWF